MKDGFSGFDAPVKKPVKCSSKGHRGGYGSRSLHGDNRSFDSYKSVQSVSERSDKVHPERAVMAHLDRAALVKIARASLVKIARVAMVNLSRVAIDNPARAAMVKLAR